MDVQKIIKDLWIKISNLIDEKTSNLHFDKTFKATIWKVNENNTYSINYKGRLYDVKNATSSLISLGQTVWVVIPNGILREMFICGAFKNEDDYYSSIEELSNAINVLQKKVESNTSQINDLLTQQNN